METLLERSNLGRRGTLPGDLESGSSRSGALIDQHDLGAVDVIGDHKMNAIVTLEGVGTAVTEILVEVRVDRDMAELGGRESLDEVHDVGTGTDGVLAVAGVNLPGNGSISAGWESDAGIVSRLELLDNLATAEVLRKSTGVGNGASGGGRVLAGQVNAGHLHAGGKIHSVINTSLNLVERTGDG